MTIALVVTHVAGLVIGWTLCALWVSRKKSGPGE